MDWDTFSRWPREFKAGRWALEHRHAVWYSNQLPDIQGRCHGPTLTHILEPATWRGFDDLEIMHSRTSTPASTASPTMLPMPIMVIFLYRSRRCYSIPYSRTYPIPTWLLAPHPMPPYASGLLGSGDHALDESYSRYRVFYPASSCLLLVFYLLPSAFTLCDLVYSCL